jgi:hypothetical protein
MAFGIHLGDDTRPVLVDRTLAQVVSSDEESCLRVPLLELRQDVLGVDVRTVIVGDSNSLWANAFADSHTAIFDASELGTGIFGS